MEGIAIKKERNGRGGKRSLWCVPVELNFNFLGYEATAEDLICVFRPEGLREGG